MKISASLLAVGIGLAGVSDTSAQNDTFDLDFATRPRRANVASHDGQQFELTPEDYPFVVLDVETTGFGDDHQPIEIAAIKVSLRDGSEVVEEFETFVYCPTTVPKFIRDLTGITNEMLESAPLITKVIPELSRFVADCAIVAHNAVFDRRVLNQVAEQMGLSFDHNNWICTMKMSQSAFNRPREKGAHTLAGLADFLGIESKPTHRALDDVRTTMQLYACCRAVLGADFHLPPIEFTRSVEEDTPITDTDLVDLTDQVIVFTGFRSAVLAARIAEAGGTVKGNVSKQVTLVLMEDSTASPTGKVKKALEYGIAVQDRQSFEQQFQVAL